ncbi:DNA/RNA helicase domain-containing protein [Streptococcus dentiloxodontae]
MDFLTLENDIEGSAYQSIADDDLSLDKAIKRNEKEYIKYYKSVGYPFKHASELVVFCQFINLLKNKGISDNEISYFSDNFNFGYEIPQIAKEFDLIRIGSNYNISIELKSNTTIDEQEKQLQKNEHYLKFLEVPTRYFSFSPTIESYIEYDSENKEFKPIDFKKFWKIISEQVVRELNREEINKLFAVSNYLVSPFNNVDKFLESEYFLTGHQEEIVKEIESENHRIYAIKGNPGTGKTLLIYHLAKRFITNNKKIVILHGGNLNDGQLELNKHNFNIKSIKFFQDILDNSNDYDFIILDEAQRLRREQMERLITTINSLNLSVKFLISMDAKQILGPKEDEKLANKFFEAIKKSQIGKTFSLKDKIRSNKEMSSFIKLLNKIPIDNTTKLANKNKNIQVKYFAHRVDADQYIKYISSKGDWQVLTYTKSNPNYKRESDQIDKMIDEGYNSHQVIGQEFDKVLIPMDDNFQYSQFVQNGKRFEVLNTSRSYYRIDKMFYQNITRTRTKLQLVIIENFPLYKKITGLLEEF